MDIYRFLNSRDIAAHCREINKTWNTCEMAAIIDRSNRSMKEKHAAWRELITDYPDMPVPKRGKRIKSLPSLHAEIKKVIAYEERVLEVFKQPEEKAIYQYGMWSSNYIRAFSHEPCVNSGIYFTFDDVWAEVFAHKKKSKEAYGEYSWWNEKSDKITIEKRYASKDGETERIIIHHDYDFNPCWITNYTEHDVFKEFTWLVDFAQGFVIDIPVPFKRGDVLTINSFWFDKDEIIFVLDNINFKRETSDCFYAEYQGNGYYVYDDGLLYKDHSPHYLSNIYDEYSIGFDEYEYYRGKLTNKDRLLYFVSQFLKEKFDLVDLLNMQSRVLVEEVMQNSINRVNPYCLPSEEYDISAAETEKNK